MHFVTGYLFQFANLALFLKTQSLKLLLILQVSKHAMLSTQRFGLQVVSAITATLTYSALLVFYGRPYLVVIFCNSHKQIKRIHLSTLAQLILKDKLLPKPADQSCKSHL